MCLSLPRPALTCQTGARASRKMLERLQARQRQVGRHPVCFQVDITRVMKAKAGGRNSFEECRKARSDNNCFLECDFQQTPAEIYAMPDQLRPAICATARKLESPTCPTMRRGTSNSTDQSLNLFRRPGTVPAAPAGVKAMCPPSPPDAHKGSLASWRVIATPTRSIEPGYRARPAWRDQARHRVRSMSNENENKLCHRAHVD